MTPIEDPEYLNRMIEIHEGVAEIRTNVKGIKENCERHECLLKEHEERIRTIERDQGNIFKLLLRPILVIFGKKI